MLVILEGIYAVALVGLILFLGPVDPESSTSGSAPMLAIAAALGISSLLLLAAGTFLMIVSGRKTETLAMVLCAVTQLLGVVIGVLTAVPLLWAPALFVLIVLAACQWGSNIKSPRRPTDMAMR